MKRFCTVKIIKALQKKSSDFNWPKTSRKNL